MDAKLYQASRRDWLNLNTLLAVIIYGVVAGGSVALVQSGANAVYLADKFAGLLAWMVTLFPAILIGVVFGAYRGTYKGITEQRRVDKEAGRKILTWRRYALPMTILTSLMTFFIAAVLYEDMAYSSETIRSGQFAFGTFAFPIYFGAVRIEIPSAILWFGFLGYLITLIGVMLRRIITNNLVPHFYFASSFRLIKSLVAAVLAVMIVNGLSDGFTAVTVLQSSEAQVDLSLHPFFNLLLAFVAGATADDIIGWVIERVRKSIGRSTVEALTLSTVQGIDPTLEAYLHEEGIDSIQMLATMSVDDLVSATNIARETIQDWQAQAQFLRSLDSPAVAAKFHRLGINELSDLDSVEKEKLSKALVLAGTEKDLENREVFAVLLDVLISESKRKTTPDG